MLEEKYPNIKFCNGRRKYDWKVLYDFKYSEPNMIELYSSVTSLFKSDSKILRVLDDWWPWLYARLRNKKNLNKWLCFKEKINAYIVPNKGEDYILIDYEIFLFLSYFLYLCIVKIKVTDKLGTFLKRQCCVRTQMFDINQKIKCLWKIGISKSGKYQIKRVYI